MNYETMKLVLKLMFGYKLASDLKTADESAVCTITRGSPLLNKTRLSNYKAPFPLIPAVHFKLHSTEGLGYMAQVLFQNVSVFLFQCIKTSLYYIRVKNQ